MRFPFLPVHSNEDITRNFEEIVSQGMYSGAGVPKFLANQGDMYFRRDTTAASGNTIYKCEGGTTWTAVA